MADTYEVVLQSHQIIGGYVHNEVVFTKNGQVICAFNGHPRNRATGDYQQGDMTGTSTLRVQATEGASMDTERDMWGKDKISGMKVLGKAVLFTGSEDEIKKLMGKAMDAATFINAQNIDYNLLQNAQNSNSAASTIVAAMGLHMSPEATKFHAPGHDRILLPEHWQAPSASLTEAQLSSYIVATTANLSKYEVTEQVKKEPNRYANVVGDNPNPNAVIGGELFNPQKTVPVAPPTIVVLTEPTRVGPMLVVKPTLEQLQDIPAIKDTAVSLIVAFSKTAGEGREVTPEQAQSLLSSHPAIAAECIKRALEIESVRKTFDKDPTLLEVVSIYASELEKMGARLATAAPSVAAPGTQEQVTAAGNGTQPPAAESKVEPKSGIVQPVAQAQPQASEAPASSHASLGNVQQLTVPDVRGGGGKASATYRA